MKWKHDECFIYQAENTSSAKTSSVTAIQLATISGYALQNIWTKLAKVTCIIFPSQFCVSCPSFSTIVEEKLGCTLLTRAQSLGFQKKLLWISSSWDHSTNSIKWLPSVISATFIRKNCLPALLALIGFLLPSGFFLLGELWSLQCACEVS